MAVNSPTSSTAGAWRSSLWFILILGALLILVGAWLFRSGGLQAIGSQDRAIQWLGLAVLMLVLLVVVGFLINQRPLGALIDENFKMSLSRLQITLWTVMVLSAYLIIAIPRILGQIDPLNPELEPSDPMLIECQAQPDMSEAKPEECPQGALQITFPPELVVAMGISAASFAGSGLIQGTKKNKKVDLVANAERLTASRTNYETAEKEFKKATKASAEANAERKQIETELNALPATPSDARNEAEARLGSANQTSINEAADMKARKEKRNQAKKEYEAVKEEEEKAKTEKDVTHRNTNSKQASLLDLFRGNEKGNYKLIDISKVQMFFFTIVVLFAYGVALAALLHDAPVLAHPLGVGFPPFSNSLNALMAISHGTYLSAKATDHTPTQA